jgi:hypothetical protein
MGEGSIFLPDSVARLLVVYSDGRQHIGLNNRTGKKIGQFVCCQIEREGYRTIIKFSSSIILLNHCDIQFQLHSRQSHILAAGR